MKKSRYPELKQELKDLARDIRFGKSKRKPKSRIGLTPEQLNVWQRTERNRYVFRHKHIAYCQLRGRQRYEIERPAKDNLPNESWIKEIMADHAEDVCVSAERSA